MEALGILPRCGRRSRSSRVSELRSSERLPGRGEVSRSGSRGNRPTTFGLNVRRTTYPLVSSWRVLRRRYQGFRPGSTSVRVLLFPLVRFCAFADRFADLTQPFHRQGIAGDTRYPPALPDTRHHPPASMVMRHGRAGGSPRSI